MLMVCNRPVEVNSNFGIKITMILKFLLVIFLKTSECVPSYGKIMIENKSAEVIRVTLSPAINWNYYEYRTNHTLVRNPGKITGGNIIM